MRDMEILDAIAVLEAAAINWGATGAAEAQRRMRDARARLIAALPDGHRVEGWSCEGPRDTKGCRNWRVTEDDRSASSAESRATLFVTHNPCTQ